MKFYALRASPAGPQFGGESTPHGNESAPLGYFPCPRLAPAIHFYAQGQVHPGARMRLQIWILISRAHRHSNSFRRTAKRLALPKQNRQSGVKLGVYRLGDSPTSKVPKPSTTRGHKTNYPEEPRCIAMIASLSIYWHLI